MPQMPIFFGFIPSEHLYKNIQNLEKQRHSDQALYPLRDEIALQINDEILDSVLGRLIANFPASDKKDTAEKLVGYVKSTVRLLLKQLLSPCSNAELQASIDFIQSSLFVDDQGQTRVGAPLDAQAAQQIKSSFNALLEGASAKTLRPILIEHYKQLTDQVIRHFMLEFYRTLNLGMIKRKAADLGASAVSKAMHIGIDKLIPHLHRQELLFMVHAHDDLVHIQPH
jgi:hypothetical protein